MLHVTCDLCGKELPPGDDHRYVVKIEVFAAHDPAEITEADLDEDHMEAISQMIQDMDELEEVEAFEADAHNFRYDLCPACRKRYLRAPLSKEAAVAKLDFSDN